MNWDIKFKDLKDNNNLSRLRSDLNRASALLSDYTDLKDLEKVKIRVFSLPDEYDAHEVFFKDKFMKYVCLDSRPLKRRWFALQCLLHGLAHSFCYLRNEMGEEMFCEKVSYEIMSKLAPKRALRSIVSLSNPNYRQFLRKGNLNKLIQLNKLAKRRRITKRKEKLVIRRMIKSKVKFSHIQIDMPELEKGFRII